MQKQEDPRIKQVIKVAGKYDNFPKPGVNFIDIFPIVANNTTLSYVVDMWAQRLSSVKYAKIFMLESRGFVFAVPLSLKVKKPCYPIRKKGKLPGEVIQYSYNLEYGSDTIQIQKYTISEGDQVIIVDDILATGGTLNAAIALLTKQGAKINKILLVCEIDGLNGRKNLGEYSQKVQVLFAHKQHKQ